MKNMYIFHYTTPFNTIESASATGNNWKDAVSNDEELSQLLEGMSEFPETWQQLPSVLSMYCITEVDIKTTNVAALISVLEE
jgi:hypothetical protein